MADEIKNVEVEVNPEAKAKEAVEPVKPKRGGSRKKKAEAVSATLEVSNSVYDQILEETRITNSLIKDLIGTIVSIADSIAATNKEYNDKAINMLNEQIERQKPIIDHQLESLNANHDDLVTQINKSFERMHSNIVDVANQSNKAFDKVNSYIDAIDSRLRKNEKFLKKISSIILETPMHFPEEKKNKKKK